MEKLLEPYDKEYMRMAILKHEETFKEQVYELHRLYRVQKLLMRNIGSNNNGRSDQGLRSTKNGINLHNQTNHHAQQQDSIKKLDVERPAEEYVVAESNVGARGLNQLIDESEIELTLGPTRYHRRKKSETSDSVPSFSSSSTGSNHINRTSSLTHQKTNLTRDEFIGCKSGLVQVPDMTLGYQSGNKNITDHVEEEELRQKRLKQPLWLFQVLSLKS